MEGTAADAPSAVAPHEPPTEHLQACEVCGLSVLLERTHSRSCAQEFIRVLWPQQAQLGWIWRPEESVLELLTCCSAVCLEQWFTAQRAPSV